MSGRGRPSKNSISKGLEICGIDPFSPSRAFVIFSIWVFFYFFIALLLSTMHGGLSFGKHVRISEVKVDMGNDDSFSDMVNFINLYYPKDADADERKYLSLADLGYSMVVDKREAKDKGFDIGGNTMLEDYTWTGRDSLISKAYKDTGMDTGKDVTPYYGFANGVFKDALTDAAHRPTHDMAYLSICFDLVNIVQHMLFISWLVLLLCILLAIFVNVIWWSCIHNKQYSEASGTDVPLRFTYRINVILLTIVNILTVTAWAVMISVWMSGIFKHDRCAYLTKGYVNTWIGLLITFFTIGVTVTTIYISAAYWRSRPAQTMDDDERDDILETDEKHAHYDHKDGQRLLGGEGGEL